ncbi:unnamed protein product [Durusdinium trenchii]|uniref:Uncharacterized protein n=1 Tax=Durusdinium trenchii TaxID=1381693 RepID=A0ABP0SH45_9DINO
MPYGRHPISHSKSLPSLSDPRKGPSFTTAPRFGRDLPTAHRSSLSRASSQTREPGSPGKSKTGGYRDQARPVAPQHEGKAPWKQVREELVPAEVREEVKRLARPTGGGVVIEMQWGSSAYLPAHNGGLKYREYASRLQELLSGRLSRGSELPVHIVDQPMRFKKKVSGIYDQFSDWERACKLVASNRSFDSATASRVGAFEVHVVQSNWHANLCAGKVEGNQAHGGPPVCGPQGILCTACAQRAEGDASVSSGGGGGGMREQHTLCHSKLWSRHWPDLWCVLASIGTLTIREAPGAQKPLQLWEVPVPLPTPAGEALKSCEFVLRQSFQASSEQEERRDERGKAEQQWSQLREACKAEEQQLRREYEAELEQGQKEAEKIYVKLCLSLVRRVSDHGLDVSRLQNGEATAEEAHRTLLEAIELNERRKDQVSGWYEEVNSWRGRSLQEKEMFDAILQQRPDVERMIGTSNEEAEVEALQGEIQRKQEEMREATRSHDKKEIYQGKIHELTHKFDRQLEKYLESLGL